MSSSSRARGGASKPARKEKDVDEDEDDAPSGGRLEVTLEHMRYRHMAWMGFGLVTGVLLLWKLGTVGKWVGLALIVVGAIAAYSFIRTLLFPAGTIVIGDDGAALPRGLCKGEPDRLALRDVSHAYLLRRAVPWTRAAPVLVVEAKGKAYTYPRDWFITEADQRRVVRELHARGIGGSGSKDEPADAKAAGDP